MVVGKVIEMDERKRATAQQRLYAIWVKLLYLRFLVLNMIGCKLKIDYFKIPHYA